MKTCVMTTDADLARDVKTAFSGPQNFCDHFRDEFALLRALRTQGYDLLLLDIQGDSGALGAVFSWRLCHGDQSVPVILIGDLNDSHKVVDAFEAGGDDFIGRPFSPVELRLRATAAVHRHRRSTTQRRAIEVGPYRLDRAAGAITRGDEAITLTPKEFALCWLFFSNAGVFLSRAQIAEAIWGCPSEVVGRRLEQHVHKLRKKLGLSSENDIALRTVYSLGYKLQVPREPAAHGAANDAVAINPTRSIQAGTSSSVALSAMS